MSFFKIFMANRSSVPLRSANMTYDNFYERKCKRKMDIYQDKETKIYLEKYQPIIILNYIHN